MKTQSNFWRRLMLILAIVVVLAGTYAIVIVLSSSSAERAMEETRQALRKQGFKTDLADFNFTVPSDQRGFEMSMGRLGWSNRPGQNGTYLGPPALMTAAGSNSVIVAWSEDLVKCEPQDVSWADFNDFLEMMNQPAFVEARGAALAGPIRFSLEANHGAAMLLPHLATMKRLSFALSSAMILDLHEENHDAAWTNLLADTRLVTAWEPESTEISQLVRFALASMTYEATWQALQAGGWTDERLAKLQHEWEGVDFFKGLPDTVAFKRATAVDACKRERKEESPGFTMGELFKEIAHSPQSGPRMMRDYWSVLRYRSQGTYDDERDLLLFYRDREVEVRQALQAPSWAAMRLLPGVTNQAIFTSKYRSRVQTLLNMRSISMSGGIMGQGTSILGRAAEAETRRRLILTAIALERFRIRHGHYPASLGELTPDFLKQPATDFMDGQPLRFQLTGDGRFVLYSTGLDCVDDGGLMPPRRASSRVINSRAVAFGGPPSDAKDLVWPRAASSNEIVMLHEQELQERQQQMIQSEEMQSAEYWTRTAHRQASIDKILASHVAETRDADYNGRPLSEVLRNGIVAGTNKPTLAEMLTLRRVVTGAEPETITFEAPMNYDTLTNIGSLHLCIDPTQDEESDDGCNVAQLQCSRATNGDCLLAWSTIFETPGKHALTMGLEMESPGNQPQEFVGPMIIVIITNLCQFSISSATFDPATGATFHARLPEMRADYSIEILTLKGERIKTLKGSTGNGVIDEFWDLMGDNHQKLAAESFNTIFHISLPESGRSQTLRGP